MATVGGAPGRALVLIGFMGAGKSTVASELAQALGVAALDSADEVAKPAAAHLREALLESTQLDLCVRHQSRLFFDR